MPPKKLISPFIYLYSRCWDWPWPWQAGKPQTSLWNIFRYHNLHPFPYQTNYFQQKPMLIVDDIAGQLREVDFPSVTICNLNKVMQKLAVYILLFSDKGIQGLCFCNFQISLYLCCKELKPCITWYKLNIFKNASNAL